MNFFNELLELINQLKNLFAYKDEILLYNKRTQDKANILLEQIATRTKTFDSTVKKLKKKSKEYDNLVKILDIIEYTETFKELAKLPQVTMYGFERLKYDKNEYYSFNLNKNGGTTRLIIKPLNENTIEIYLIMISYNHYKDFNPKKVIYYE